MAAYFLQDTPLAGLERMMMQTPRPVRSGGEETDVHRAKRKSAIAVADRDGRRKLKMSVDARQEQFEKVELFGKPALFTNSRIDRTTVPKGLHCYDLRGSDNDFGRPVTVEPRVAVNHAGSVITAEPVDFKGKDYRAIRGKLNFLGVDAGVVDFLEECMAEQTESQFEGISQIGGQSL